MAFEIDTRHLACVAGSRENPKFRHVREVLAVHVSCTHLSHVLIESLTAVSNNIDLGDLLTDSDNDTPFLPGQILMLKAQDVI